jgi:hypothetical protein
MCVTPVATTTSIISIVVVVIWKREVRKYLDLLGDLDEYLKRG